MAEALLDRDDLGDLHWVCVRRGPNEDWMERALLALDRGWEPERVVSYTQFSESTWWGEESHHWQAKIDAFSGLDHGSDGRRARIIDAGLMVFGALRERASTREHRERVFGL